MILTLGKPICCAQLTGIDNEAWSVQPESLEEYKFSSQKESWKGYASNCQLVCAKFFLMLLKLGIWSVCTIKSPYDIMCSNSSFFIVLDPQCHHHSLTKAQHTALPLFTLLTTNSNAVQSPIKNMPIDCGAI